MKLTKPLTSAYRTIAGGGTLGWKIESNWTDPFLFAIYSVIRPLSGAAILVVMFSIVSGGDFSSPYYTGMYLGNAFYTFVGTLMTGISWAIADDRERYRTLKYVYISPIRFWLYLIGRSLARVAIGTAAVVITLVCGLVFLHVSVPLAMINWPLFLVSFATGLLMLSAMGLILAGVAMVMVHQMEYLGDTVSGAMYLFSGAVFPLTILPAVLQPFGYALPLTYWFELLRRSLIGDTAAAAFPGFEHLSTQMVFAIFAGCTVAMCIAARTLFSWFERRARERGYIDWVSNF